MRDLWKKRTLQVVFLVGLGILLAACSAAPDAEDDHASDAMTIPPIDPVELSGGDRLRVTATTTIIGDVVANIGQENIELFTLGQPGQDPHSYEPTARDLVVIEQAHIIFVNGLGLEEGLLDTIETTASGAIVPVSAGIDVREITARPGEDDHNHVDDPHFWLDPNNVIIWAENIADVLSEADTAHADAYQENASAYIAELEALDALIREQVAAIPAENRKLVTDHMTFGYFADEYGFEVIGTVIPGANTTAESSAGDLAELVEKIEQAGVPVVFVGLSSSERLQQLADLVAEESGAEIAVLPVYTGALDRPGEPGDSYLGLMRFNLEQIVYGLSE